MLKGIWCKCCIQGDYFVKVARVYLENLEVLEKQAS